MANWRLAQSLIQLRHQINTLHPARSKVSDGSIGDSAHSSRASDHNPNSAGVVTAIDITHDPAHDVNGSILGNQLTQDSRVKYLIFAGLIWKSRIGRWETYRGSNAHLHHIHVSIKAESADDTAAWLLSGEVAREILKLGSKGDAVFDLQRALNRIVTAIPMDGKFGPLTLEAVKAFQRSKGLAETGQADASVWAALEDK